MRTVGFVTGLMAAGGAAGCGGGDECVQEGVAVEDPTVPAGGMTFALAPVLAEIEGDYAGTIETDAAEGPLELTVTTDDDPRVVYGEEECRRAAYEVGFRLELRAAASGVDAVTEIDVPLPQRVFVLTLNDEKRIEESGVSLTAPEMEGGEEVWVTLTSRWDGEAWNGEITWRFAEGGFEPEGTLATWNAE